MKIIAEEVIKITHPRYNVRIHRALHPDETALSVQQFSRLNKIVEQNLSAYKKDLAAMLIEEANVVMVEVTSEGEGVVLHKVWLG